MEKELNSEEKLLNLLKELKEIYENAISKEYHYILYGKISTYKEIIELLEFLLWIDDGRKIA